MNKNSIRMKILLPHLMIIIISLLICGFAVNVVLRTYLSQQVKNEIIACSTAIKTIAQNDMTPFDNRMPDNFKRFHTFMRIDRTLNDQRFLRNANYAIVTDNSEIIYPREQMSSQYTFVAESLLPYLKNNKEAMMENRISNHRIDESEYMISAIPISENALKNNTTIILYADLSQMQTIQSVTNMILLIVLLFTAVIATITAINTSSVITKPLTDLCAYAHTISERNFDARDFTGTSSEIEELAQSMTKMAKKLEAYDTSQKTFLQNASHELRTPLMSIHGYAEGIQLGILKDITSATNIIIEESKRMTKLVENILFLSRLDTLMGFYQMQKLSLNQLIESIIIKVAGIALQQNKSIISNIPEEDIEIDGDEEKLSRAFINIIGNCLRYAEKNVTIQLEVMENKAVIFINDDGPGFDEEDLKNLFVRFYKGNKGQFGLGLPIAQSIIEKHHGKINAGNLPESGASFIITLPLDCNKSEI